MRTAMLTSGKGWIFVGAAVCFIAALLDRALFLPSFLYAILLWLFVSLGALVFLMVHHLTGGRWGFQVRRVLEAATAPLPVLSIAFFIFFFAGETLRAGEGYFAPGWIAFRAAVCFALWIAMATALRKRSLRQDRSEDPVFTREMRTISGPGLVIIFLTVSFAMTDWLMQLTPGWRSTMFPGIMIASQGLLALSGAVAVSPFLRPDFGRDLHALHDLGTLLFAFVFFWAYVSFSQFLVVWSGNLPHETLWYRQRNEGGWHGLAFVIGAFCFFAPAAVLLFQGPKHSLKGLATVAAGIALSQAVFLFWVVMPSFYPAIHLGWRDVVVPLAVGAIWVVLFLKSWRSALPLPRHDPRLEALAPLAS